MFVPPPPSPMQDALSDSTAKIIRRLLCRQPPSPLALVRWLNSESLLKHDATEPHLLALYCRPLFRDQSFRGLTLRLRPQGSHKAYGDNKGTAGVFMRIHHLETAHPRRRVSVLERETLNDAHFSEHALLGSELAYNDWRTGPRFSDPLPPVTCCGALAFLFFVFFWIEEAESSKPVC